MEPDGNPAEGAEVGRELNFMGGNHMMSGERSGQDDVSSLQRVAPVEHVL